MRVIFYNGLFLAIFLLVGTVVTEIFLRFDGRYADLVNENLIRSRAIWDRPPNAKQYRKHPDLKFKVEIVFNDFQIRNHANVSLMDIEEFQGVTIGVFGDSFTENRRIQDRFTFTSLLNEIMKPEYLVLNFGIDGYGLDQCYLKYLDFKLRHKLNHVFYVFFSNDFRNIYENQLFDFNNDTVVSPGQPDINPYIEYARKYHVSYLLIDGFARLKAHIESSSYSLADLNNKIRHRWYSSQQKRKQQSKRVHDEYADSLVRDYLSDAPSQRTLIWAKRFRQLLGAWNSDIESQRGKFTIIVVPDQVSTDLAKKLFGNQYASQTVYLSEYFPDGLNGFKFSNDNHWNEKGNLRAAQAIAQWGSAVNYWPETKLAIRKVTRQAELEIENLYKQ